MKTATGIFILVAFAFMIACNAAKSVDPTGRGPVPRGVRASQQDTSAKIGKKDTLPGRKN